MQISDEIKAQILATIDLSDLIGEVVELRRKGGNYSGLCPFHKEKTPSFMVSPGKGIYKCFGCGKAGNAITFMKDYHGLSFVESVKELAKRAGIHLEEGNEYKAKEELTKKDVAYLTLEITGKFFEKCLGAKEGKTALSYFRKRGFSAQTISEFQLGYAPDAWDRLINELQNQNISIEAMLDAGLILKHETKGTYYDRFRNRAVFPIHNYIGKIIGYGARILTEDKDQPKYLNSPQTIVYDKSKTLYGINFAKNEIRTKGFAILVEGYTDTISLHQAGFRNVVASSGTSLTTEQLNVLYKLCKRLYFVYDADSAGIKAAERGLDMALAKGFEVLIVQLPSGEDPDSLILNHGPALFQSCLSDAAGFLDFLVNEMKKQGKFDTPHLKADSIRTILNIIVKIPDSLLHDEYISKMASMLHLTDNQVKKVYAEKAKIEAKLKGRSTEYDYSETRRIENDEKAVNDSEIKVSQRDYELLKEEQAIFALALNDDHAFSIIFGKMKINSDIFISDEAKRLFDIMATFVSFDGNYLGHILETDEINEEDKNYFSQIGLKIDELSPNWKKFLKTEESVNIVKHIKDLFYNLELVKVNRRIDELKAELGSNKEADMSSVLRMISELSQKKVKLSSEIVNGK